MNNQRWIGILLILVGLGILLHQLDFLHWTARSIVAVIFILLGVRGIRFSTQHPRRKGLLSGTFFMSLGLATLILGLSFHADQRPLTLAMIFFFPCSGQPDLFHLPCIR